MNSTLNPVEFILTLPDWAWINAFLWKAQLQNTRRYGPWEYWLRWLSVLLALAAAAGLIVLQFFPFLRMFPWHVRVGSFAIIALLGYLAYVLVFRTEYGHGLFLETVIRKSLLDDLINR